MKTLLISFLIFTFVLSADYQTGEKIYFQKGCNSCHGANAEGLHEFPKLANQKEKYLLKKLKAYRADQIKTPQASIMTGYAKALSQEEMHHVIFYLTNYKAGKSEESYDDSFDSWGDGGS